MDFDPDTYLDERQPAEDNGDGGGDAPSFNPDAYLNGRQPAEDDGGDAPGFNPDQYIKSFNPDDYLQNLERPEAEGEIATFGREAAHSAVPAAGGLVAGAASGAALGAAGGALAGPIGAGVGTIGGAIVGGLAGAYGTEKAQEAGLNALGFDDSQQRAANIQANPKSAFAGQMAPALATMRPDKMASVAQRGLSAGLMGGVEAGQELYNEGTVSPGKVAASAMAGAVLPTPNRVGSRIIGAGENVGNRVAASVPGRPGKSPDPAAVPAQDEVQRANDQPIVTGENALEQPAPSVQGDTVGNPQSAATRSERQYGKGKAPAGEAGDMLTQGDVSPDVAQALQAHADQDVPRVAAEGSWLGEDAPSPSQGDFQYTGTKPVETGIAEAAGVSPNADIPEKSPNADISPPAAQQAIAASKANAAKPKLTLKKPATDQSLGFENLGGAGKAMGESLRSMLWDRAQAGKENEGTGFPKSPLMTATKQLRARGALRTREQFDAFANEQAAIPAGADFGKNMIELMRRYLPPDDIHAKVDEAAQDVHPNPSAAQAEAGNFSKGHPGKVFGREFSIETAKGGVREDKKNTPPEWRVEDYPTHYGELLGTKGADGDRIDYHHVGTGDRHFVIDQRDLATGKFDEHKIMGYAKDPADAIDHYARGFNDDKGLDRAGSITEASAEDLKKWLAKPGAKKEPYDAGFKAEEAAGPTEGEKPLPKVVTAAVTKLKADGRADLAEALLNMEPSARLGAAAKYVNNTTADLTRPDRIRTPAPTVAGLVTDEGKPVTARTKADAAAKSADVAKMNAAFDTIKAKMPEKLPETKEEKAALYNDLKAFLDETKAVTYRPSFKHAPYLLARAAKKLTLAKNPSERGWTEFAEVMHQLRAGNEADVRQGQRIDADIGRSKRSGDDAVANAEAKSAGNNDIEDAMIRAIDAKRGYIDVPHEEAEAFVKPKPVRSRADIKEPKGTVDATTPEGQKSLAEALGGKVSETEAKAASDAKAKAEQEALSEAGRQRAAKSVGTDKAALNAKYAEMLKLAEAKGKSHAAPEALPAEVKDLKPAAKDLFEKFVRDEGGGLNLHGLVGDMLDAFKNTAARLRGTSKPDIDHVARSPKSMQEEFARSLSNELHQIRQADIDHKLSLLKTLNSLPKELNNPAALEKVYLAREAGKIGDLPPELKALYDEHLKPMLDENDQLYDNIKAIDPSKVGPEVQDHIYRIIKGADAEHNLLMSAASSDPIEGTNAITTAQKGPAMARRFVALERQDGKRFVISLNEDGFTIWKDGKYQKIADPTFKFEAGQQIKVGNNTFKMDEALTPEIEQHAKMDSGKKAEYYHNAALSAASANSYLGSLARHLQYLHNLKSDPEFLRYAKAPGAEHVPDGYVSTSLPNFKGWKMDPQLAYTMDDFAQPGFNEPGLNTLRKLSQAVTKTIFWMPTAHINNVGTHWFVERGWNWLPGTGGYRSLAVNGAKAIKSVIAQDHIQSELREAGAGTIYGGILTQKFMDQMGKAVGEDIRRNPSKWDPIAKTLGVGPSTLAGAIYRGASKVMWAANDMFLTQAVLENMDHGMGIRDAIIHAERHIPNYRVPATVMGTGRGARIFSQVMQEPTLMAFGRYHYGVFNSYANMVKDLVKGSGARRLEAVGNLMAMGVLSFAIYPVMDKLYQGLTGNDDATAQRRGPLAIPHHLGRALQGKEDIMGAARSTFTVSPALNTSLETLRNQDWRGKPIVEPGDVRQAAKGSLKAAGRVALQEGKHLATGLVSPLGTLEQAASKKQGLGATLRDQALDIRNPSPQARKYEANVPKTTYQQSKSRFKKATGIEGAYNKTFGY